MAEINTHGLICEFGKRHRGERWTRIPISYLKWICSEGQIDEAVKEIARAEINRRGSTTPKIDVSGHAIDRASQSLRKTWHETKIDDEGIYSWLCRMAGEAMESGERLESGKIRYKGMKFVFAEDGDFPILKTISR